MRLLWLTPEAPDPKGAGGAIRSYHQLASLARRGVELTAVAPAHATQAEGARPLAELGVDLGLVRRPPNQVAEALRGIGRRPRLAADALLEPWLGLQAGVFWTALEPIVQRRLAARRYDAVVVEHDFAAGWVAHLPAELPAGLVFHNAYWLVYERRPGVLAKVESRRFRAYVEHHLPRFARGFAVSHAERTDIADLAPQLHVDVIPNGVAAAPLGRLEPGSGRPGALLFVGTLSYRPNAEGIAWFCEQVLPHVRAVRPDVTLTIVGRGAPPAVQALGRRPGIRLTGWVEDIVPFLAEAEVAIAPLRSGGGTNLKVIEALAAGRALVTTSFGAQGLDLVDREHLLVTDGADAFAAAVNELLGDPPLRRRLGSAGRERAAERYDWDVVGGQMHAALERWLG